MGALELVLQPLRLVTTDLQNTQKPLNLLFDRKWNV